MGRRRAALAKRTAGSSGRKESVVDGARPLVSIPKAKLNALKALVERHRSKDLTASWELGKLAAEVLKQSGPSGDTQFTPSQLTEDIGLTPRPDAGKKANDTTLRQLIKFADKVGLRRSRELSSKRVPWRGIVYWLGVEDKVDFDTLYDEMVSGLRNSTKIREYIETNFKKKPLPRFSGDCAEDFRKAQSHANSLAAVLDALCDSLDRHEGCGSVRERRRLSVLPCTCPFWVMT